MPRASSTLFAANNYKTRKVLKTVGERNMAEKDKIQKLVFTRKMSKFSSTILLTKVITLSIKQKQDRTRVWEISYHTLLDVWDFSLAFLALHIAFWSVLLFCATVVFPPAPLACILGRSTFLGGVQQKESGSKTKEKKKENSLLGRDHQVYRHNSWNIWSADPMDDSISYEEISK